MPDSFSLLTLNCFAAPLLTTRRRLLALARALEQRSLHVTCLQEIQLSTYHQLLAGACASYPFQAYEPFFHCPKGGLLTLSRIPLRQQRFEMYREQGRWYTLPDKILRKGMLITTLRWAATPVVIINTHLIANYIADWERHGRFAQMGQRQLRQLSDVIAVQSPEALLIVVGDFNIPRGGQLYTDFLNRTGLHDPLAGDRRPTHRPPAGIPTRFSLPIDWILIRRPPTLSLEIEYKLLCTEKQWLDNHTQDYVSDHNGIEICFTTH